MTLQTILRRLAALAAVGALTTLLGCAAINAQNPSGALKPVNAHVVDLVPERT